MSEFMGLGNAKQGVIVVSIDENGELVIDNTGKAAANTISSPNALYSGVEKVMAMSAVFDGHTPAGTAEIYDNGNGVKAFNIIMDDTVAFAAQEIVVVAYSTIATDPNALLNAQNFLTEAQTGGTRTGQAYYNIAVLTPDLPSVTIQYDGVNTIKRIVALNSTAATDYPYILTVVE